MAKNNAKTCELLLENYQFFGKTSARAKSTLLTQIQRAFSSGWLLLLKVRCLLPGFSRHLSARGCFGVASARGRFRAIWAPGLREPDLGIFWPSPQPARFLRLLLTPGTRCGMVFCRTASFVKERKSQIDVEQAIVASDPPFDFLNWVFW